jgi:hypothetical protein
VGEVKPYTNSSPTPVRPGEHFEVYRFFTEEPWRDHTVLRFWQVHKQNKSIPMAGCEYAWLLLERQ